MGYFHSCTPSAHLLGTQPPVGVRAGISLPMGPPLPARTFHRQMPPGPLTARYGTWIMLRMAKPMLTRASAKAQEEEQQNRGVEARIEAPSPGVGRLRRQDPANTSASELSSRYMAQAACSEKMLAQRSEAKAASAEASESKTSQINLPPYQFPNNLHFLERMQSGIYPSWVF